MSDANTASARATKGISRAQHRATKARRIAEAAAVDPRSTEELREAARAAYTRIQRPNSTRWDVTAYEKADDLYRARCAATGVEYERTHP